MTPIYHESVEQNSQDFTLKTYDIKKQKECPRCDGKNIFIIDKEKKSYWCKDCCCGFEKRKINYQKETVWPG
jgi:formamidopyrimidine-DNA glycosylase